MFVVLQINIPLRCLSFSLIFIRIDMTNWIIDEQWLDEYGSRFLPLPSQVMANQNNSPLHSFGDYVYPTIERLVRIIIFYSFN